MRAARRAGGAALALVLAGTRSRGGRPRDRRADLRRDGLAVAVRGRDPPVELSLLDLPARSAVQAKGRADPRPLSGRSVDADQRSPSADPDPTRGPGCRRRPMDDQTAPLA